MLEEKEGRKINNIFYGCSGVWGRYKLSSKAVQLRTMEELLGRGSIFPTHL
jgi:hypothetical protein